MKFLNIIKNTNLNDNDLGIYFTDIESYYNQFDNIYVNNDLYYHILNENTMPDYEDLTLESYDVTNLGKISIINSSHISFNDILVSNNSYLSGSGIFVYESNNITLNTIRTNNNIYGIRIESSEKKKLRVFKIMLKFVQVFFHILNFSEFYRDSFFF